MQYLLEMEFDSISSFAFPLEHELRFVSGRHCIEKWQPEVRELWSGIGNIVFATPYEL
jgi:hypothetical protein